MALTQTRIRQEFDECAFSGMLFGVRHSEPEPIWLKVRKSTSGSLSSRSDTTDLEICHHWSNFFEILHMPWN